MADRVDGRSSWLFQYQVARLLEAAQEKEKYHTDRLAFWKDEFDKAVAAAKEKGVEVREYAVTGGMRAEMVIDGTLQNRIDECRSKRERHRLAVTGFSQWVSVLDSQDENKVYDLTMDDALYFGVAERPADD